MSIQELTMTNNQKKALLRAIKNENILIQEENGDLVINVSAYLDFKNDFLAKKAEPAPLEVLIPEEELDFTAEYFVIT